MKFITKLRRDRLVAQVIANGEKLRAASAARAGIDGRVWPDDALYLDTIINTRNRKRDRLLTKLKETA